MRVGVKALLSCHIVMMPVDFYGVSNSVICLHRSPAFKISLAKTTSSLHVDQRNSAMPRMTSLWMRTVSDPASVFILHHVIYDKKGW